jgi:hypothetical protein
MSEVTLYREIDALGGTPNGDPLDAAFCDAINRVLEILTRRGFSEHRDAASATLPVPANSGEGEKLREPLRAALVFIRDAPRVLVADRGDWLTNNLDSLIAALATPDAAPINKEEIDPRARAMVGDALWSSTGRNWTDDEIDAFIRSRGNTTPDAAPIGSDDAEAR